MHFAVAAARHCLGGAGHLAGAFGRERVEDGDLRVGDRVGVVVAIHRPHVRLAAVEIEALHLEELSFDDVDGFLVERRGAAGEVRFADDPLAAGRVDDDEVVRAHRTKADGVGGIRLVGPVPLPVGMVDESLFRQDAEDLLHVDAAELLVGGERELERGALHVVDEDVQVVGVDERVLRRAVEEIRRIAHDELVDRRAARDQHGRRSRRPPAGAAGPLPCRGNRARIASHHADVEGADVDAQLQRIGGNDGADLRFAQPALDFAAAVRQIAATIAADHVRRSRRTVERILQIGREDLHREPALRKDDQLQVVTQELERDTARLGEIRPADAELGVHDGRVDEEEELLAARGAVLLDQLERTAGQSFRELARVGDRRRRTDEDRIRAVVAAHPPQAAQDVGQVAAEDAAIGVELVDDDEFQVFEQLRPARMVRQDARMHHVGIAEHHVRLAADGAARVRRRIAVVGGDADLDVRIARDDLREPVQLGELVLGEGLGREQIERTRRRVLQDRVQHRGVVAERLP